MIKVLAFTMRLTSVLLLASPGFAADDVAGILQESADAYAHLRTYSDTGVVSETPDYGDLAFETTFERPDHVRFAFKDGHPFVLLRFFTIEHILRSNGQRVTTWTISTDQDSVERIEPSLASGVAGATGVSRGSAHHIATLLMPHLWDAEAFGSSVLALAQPKLMEDASIDGIVCRHVSGMLKRGTSIDIWIARSDHLVRRIETRYAGGQVDTETHRDIRSDAAIPATTFDTRVPPRRIGERASP